MQVRARFDRHEHFIAEHSAERPVRRRFRLMRFLRDRRGETAVEYSLIASLVVLAIIASLTQFGGATNKLYNKISNAMQATP